MEAELETELVPSYWDPVIQSILTSLPKEDEEPVLPAQGTAKIFRWAAVAAAVVILAVGAWWFLGNHRQPPTITAPVAEQRFKNDVQPGTNAAVLTLADGRTVILDSAHSGALATEGSVKVTRDQDGKIVYQRLNADHLSVSFNTITNPRGSRVVPLTLSDGTKIWLDAQSSIKYPIAFTGKDRVVEITGQVYFEVAHNPSQPFEVRKQGSDAEIQVLGTHFNIMAFDDEEAMRITLLQGSVKVSKGSEIKVIQPGEQAVVRPEGPLTVDRTPDIEGTMAWKNGIFKFQDITIEPLMKQLARWYDVEVVYEDRPTDRFVSTIPRDVPASQVFKILETTGRVHFKIDGKKVTVMK
jgi:ferric-dicitrate binding protein FerR (iron transport regulator)